jgi:putative ABC transport system permease protein
MQISFPSDNPQDTPKAAEFYRQLMDRVKNLPGVEYAGVVSELPLSGQANDTSFTIDGQPPLAPGHKTYANQRRVSPDYFKALGIPLLKGRYFTDHDNRAAPKVAIISETFARRFFPSQDPLGKRITIDFRNPFDAEIVGIVGAIRHTSLDQEPWREMYVPEAQDPFPQMNLVVRSKEDLVALAVVIKKEIQTMNKDLAVYRVGTMEQVLANSIARPRLRTMLVGIFAAVALILAALGIYAVLSYSVSQRRHEIGIRMALGAWHKDVLQLIVGQGVRLALVGMAVGVLGALALSRFLANLLYGVKPTDPTTFVVVSAVLMAVSVLASYIPARRATTVDPIVALRYE